MVSIDTERLRVQAENLTKQSKRIIRSCHALDTVLIWLKYQEFEDKNQLLHNMEMQYEELEEEGSRMFLLAEGLQKVCDKYDAVEEKLADMSTTSSGKTGVVAELDIDYINRRVLYGGLNFAE